MFLRPPQLFWEYVAKAGEGRNSGWRIAAGFALIALLHIVLGIAAFAASPLILHGYCLLASCVRPMPPYWEIFDTMFTTRFGLAVLLLAVGSMWFAVLLVMRVLHRRPLSTLLGATARLSWHDFARSFAIWFVVGVVSSAIFFTMDVTAARSETNLLEWVAAFLPLSLFILLQSSAEELVFRGYLQQSLAQRFPHWLAWAILPGIAFTLPHWDFEALPWMNAAYLMSVAVFSIAMTVLVCATGNLGAAFGAHFATNLVALLLFSSDGDYRSAALFVGLPMQDPSWTPTDAALITLSMIALTALTVTLSIHPRSSLKLKSRQHSPALAI